MKKALKGLAVVLLWAVFATAALAEDSTAPGDVVFGGTNDQIYPATMSTPLRGPYQFSDINSKWNQPRYIVNLASYSNPHAGVDQRTDSQVLSVYPVTWARTYSFNDTAAPGSKDLTLQLDVNGDNVWDNVYISYLHLTSVATIVQDKTKVFWNSDVVASTGSDHLDWRFRRMAGGRLVSIHTYPYMLGTGGWNGGKSLDFIAVGGYYQNVLTVYSYVMNDGVAQDVQPGDLVYWYRRHTGLNDPWTGPVSFSKSGSKTTSTWTSTISSTTIGYATGTQIDILIRGKRSDQTAANNYKYGWFPAKFNQPGSDPKTSGYSYAYMILTIGSSGWIYGGYCIVDPEN